MISFSFLIVYIHIYIDLFVGAYSLYLLTVVCVKFQLNISIAEEERENGEREVAAALHDGDGPQKKIK